MISKEKLIELYSAMVMCRMIGERARRLAREGHLALGLHASVGREAAIAGITVDLLPEDTLETTHAAQVSNFVKGMPLDALFSEAVRSSHGNGHTARNEARLESACATAKQHKVAMTGKITVAFCDADQSVGTCWRKNLSEAGRDDLPVIFVRHRVVSEETKERKRGLKRAALPAALEHGVPVIYVDSDDVVAVYRVASESIARARQRRGPTLIDCIAGGTAREGSAGMGSNGHTDPLAIMESHLAGKGLFNRGLKKKITEGFTPQLEKATRGLVHSLQG